MASQLKRLGLNKSFGGFVTKWEHFSAVLGLTAKFSIFMPAGASNDARVHCLYFLSGLTCNEDNFIQKAGATREANAQHLAIVCPDTSPRGAGVPTEDDNWDFGTGAGFYVDATTDGWKKNYKMYSYVTKELPALIEENFPVTNRKSVFGHSMGGHGALSLYLKNPGLYQSASAFSPICNPTNCPWGKKALSGYLGNDEADWKEWDSSQLVSGFTGQRNEILIDQGAEDGFLKDGQLLPEAFAEACQASKHPLTLRMQEGYDHSYFFISSFVDDHIKHHSSFLNAQ
uniref:S-formylglutathione hydrolase n=1 Tax=Hirondellea gigas TaxID=1518452 RepID=A0A2P2IFA4_9CRUS